MSPGDQGQVFPSRIKVWIMLILKDDARIVLQTCCTCFHLQRQGVAVHPAQLTRVMLTGFHVAELVGGNLMWFQLCFPDD